MRRKSRQKNKGEPKKCSGVFYRRNIIALLSTFALEGWLNGHSLRVGSQSSTSLSRVAWSILECARRTSTFLSCAFREQEDDQAALPILLRARAPGAQDQCGCPSILFIVRVLRARRAPGRSLPHTFNVSRLTSHAGLGATNTRTLRRWSV
jgi:hypothetical protein